MRERVAAAPVIAVVAAATFGLSACGGTSPPPVASLGTSTTGPAASTSVSGSLAEAEVKFTQCMRSHGVPNFPDPVNKGTTTAWLPGAPSRIDENSATFQSAWGVCQKEIPGNPGGSKPRPSPEQKAQLLEYAQ